MNRDKLKKLYEKYELTAEDIFKHKHYVIITRSGIEKIAAIQDITIEFEVVKCEPNFAAVKATAYRPNEDIIRIQTFGSALKGKQWDDGNTNSFYVIEMAEKRAMSRAVLKLSGFYELGVFGEDESEDFKRK
tara:strand:- start:138 stop:533 length:396 start_codon:yes stop_codon:yes gene_type:complete